MIPITIKFQAFIPKSLGKSLLSYFQNHSHFNTLKNKDEFTRKIRNIDAKGYTWLPEPGNSFSHKYFATDDVEMFNHHSKHSTRLAIEITIDPKKIGNYHFPSEILKHDYHKNYGGTSSQHSGESHQIEAHIKKVPEMLDTGTAFVEMGNHYIGICSDTIKHKRSDEKPLDIKIKNSLSGTYFHQAGTGVDNDTTNIKVSASAGYPFAEPASPNIDFELEIELYKNLSNKAINVNIKGKHNDFPAYKLVIGHRTVYTHNPSDYGYTGPGFRNLWKSRSFNKTEWIRLKDRQVRNLKEKNTFGW